jgi:hypothetical protein
MTAFLEGVVFQAGSKGLTEWSIEWDCCAAVRYQLDASR